MHENHLKVISWQRIQQLLPWVPAGPVLDLGAGRGQLAYALADYGFQVTAVDQYADTDVASHPRLSWQHTDLRQLELGDQTWAAIVCLNVFPFLSQAEQLPQLQRLKAALQPDGLLIFSSFTANDPGAAHSFARDPQGQPCPTGVLELASLKQVFADWEWWWSFEGNMHDDHPPAGPHQHGLVQVILKKPACQLQAVDWNGLPSLGVGLGWRHALQPLLAQQDVADFIEIMSDDYLNPVWDGHLLELSQRYQVIPHGVELSVGTPNGHDPAYLAQIRRIANRCNSPWWSDHLCYTHSQNVKTWSLNPLPCSEEALEVVTANARQAIAAVGRPLLLENVAYYWRPELPDQLADGEFMRRVVEGADCGILLDVANLYGNAHNFGLDPYEFVRQLPAERVVQLHLAGGKLFDKLLFDTHDHPVAQETWKLLQFVLKHCDVKAISLERDGRFEALEEVLPDLKSARQLLGVRV